MAMLIYTHTCCIREDVVEVVGLEVAEAVVEGG